MKILLVGEYSNVHATLALGLKELGHQVTVISNGDFFKDYPRDIDVTRRPGKLGGIRLIARLYTLLPKLRGYDIVQLINPMFFELKAERLFWFYRYLRKHNKRVFILAPSTSPCAIATSTWATPFVLMPKPSIINATGWGQPKND